MLLCVWAALLGVASASTGAHQDKSVIASLSAQWASTSLIAETSEFIGKESNATFWKYVANVVEATNGINWETINAEKQYELAVKAATPLLSSSALDLLRFSLSIRALSPSVQLFQQVGDEHTSTTCAAFFDVNGIIGCTTKELEEAVEKADKSISSEVLSVDHVLSFAAADDKNPLVIVIFGELGSPSWTLLHSSAKSIARQNKALYIHRHFSRKPSSERVALSGYGVELAIKNTEYKAEDDSNKKDGGPQEDEEDLHGFNIKLLKELHPSESESLAALRMHLKDIEELAPLKQWQVQNLAFQAAHKILNVDAAEAIPTLKELSQNFPLHARHVATEQVSEAVRAEIESNQEVLKEMGIDTGDSVLFVNGINTDVDQLDLFQLIDTLKQEEKLATGFFQMGVGSEYLPMLSNMDLTDEKTNYAVDYREAEPIFINDLDKDKKYSQWGNSVRLMLQPYYPGMIRPIARNLFTLILVVDPTDPVSRDLVSTAAMFLKHDVAMRIGLVFSVSDDPAISGRNDAGVATLNLFNYIRKEKDAAQALHALAKMFNMLKGDRQLTTDLVKNFYDSNYGDSDYEEVFGPKSEYGTGRTAGREWLAKTTLGDAPVALINGYPLEEIKQDKFEEAVMMEVMKISPKIQKAIMTGKLTDRSNVANWMMEQPDVMPRLNKRILDAPATKRYIDLTDTTACAAKSLSDFSRLPEGKKAACVVERMRYVQRGEEDSSTRPLTLWVVADLESPEGRATLYSAMKHIKHSNNARVGLLLNPSDESAACKANSISFLVHSALRTLPQDKAKLFVPKLLKEENVAALAAGETTLEALAVGGMDVAGFLKEKKLLDCERVKMEANFLREVVGLSAGENGVVANGLVAGPLLEGETIGDEDVALLERVVVARGAQTIATNVDKWGVQKRHGKSSDTVLRAASLIGKFAAARKRQFVDLAGEKKSVVKLPAEDSTRSATAIVAVIDPLSRAGQKMASILELIRSAINCDMSIVMNPKAKLSELPLKRFFRYVGSAEVAFDATGNISPPRALFTALPSKQLLTLAMHPPDAWMIEAVSAKYDLDNIKMEQVDKDVVALFSLEHVLLEGHCFEEPSGSPPRGLQFVLGTPSNPVLYDTIVMANLGYFQLKASPGSWQLRLREGRSKAIYKVATSVNTEGSSEEGEVIRVLIDSFSGKVIRLRVSKREGMEEENVLSDSEEGGGLWDTLSTTLGANAPEKYETINVFSLASGHLYERFMRIMILSVIKKTKSPVKFWLLKNYLSPQFKETLPLMAAKYGFEYALIEYKWPRWLHQQKEKHRVMWGYKILFLDVLFPLDVQKVIFVDADQVVRSDLLELMNFDLGGAPYGYVPFCESRREMDGFRFWQQGYWANHLAGRKYHISALYAIDLKKFRQIAAGDRLRGQYQGLSSDPNSLSNLDQDLPNNMIHQVRIKSLPQEWLWCETWCDDASKAKAKTIDLCNNPQTKEPKLDSAMRIIPEWKEYDAEIKEVISKKATTASSTTEGDAHVEL